MADPFTPDDLISQLQPGGAVEGAIVRQLPMMLRFTDTRGDGQERTVEWAFLTTFDGWEVSKAVSSCRLCLKRGSLSRLEQ